MASAVKVAVRCRPLNDRCAHARRLRHCATRKRALTLRCLGWPCTVVARREKTENAKVVVQIRDNQVILTDPDKKGPDAVRPFTYDHAFWSTEASDPHFATQDDVFHAIGEDVLKNGAAPGRPRVSLAARPRPG